MYERAIKARKDGQLSPVAQTLTSLIRFKTVTGDHDEIARAYSWVKSELAHVPLRWKTRTHAGYTSLVATTRRTKAPRLWLAAHIDVVPGPPNVFVPRVSDNRLYGRGAFDMKFAIACYIEIFKALGARAAQYDIGIMLTSDEEIGGVNGTGSLLSKDGYGGGACFLPDGGGPWRIEERAKGIWFLKVVAKGVACHGSRPWEGSCANLRLISFLSDAHVLFDARIQKGSDRWHATMHIGNMQGGTAVNQLADHAEATLDIRFTSSREERMLSRILMRLAKKHRVTLTTVIRAPDYGIVRTNPLARRFIQYAWTVAGKKVGFSRSHGSSDARFFAMHGIPTLLVWPEAGGAHSQREYVSLPSLDAFFATINAFVLDVGHATKDNKN